MSGKITKTRKDMVRILSRQNVRLAKGLVSGNGSLSLDQLRDFTLNFGFSLAMGELLHLNLRFRSKLGDDELSNLILLCVRCHRQQHGGF